MSCRREANAKHSSFVLFLGHQVNPAYGNIGLLAIAILVAAYG